MTQRAWDFLTQEQRELFARDLARYFEKEREEYLGMIAAEEFLDFFLEGVGKEIYNLGVEEAKRAFQQRLEDVIMDVDTLKKM